MNFTDDQPSATEHRPLGITPPGYSIRHLQIRPGLVLAPMSGVTSRPLRTLLKELNPGAIGLVVSEFISVEGMTRDSRRSIEMMRFHQRERPFGIQIFGFDLTRMADAARMVQDAGADLLDINCGCPAPKVVKRGGGCELMRQPDHLGKLFREVRRAVSMPLTMKMRSGWDSASLNAPEIARIAENEGIEAITIHGRTRTQLYRGLADWEIVQQVAEERSVPVMGSGDVVDAESARARLQGRIAGLFIGRGALANPFVFSEIVSGRRHDLRASERLVLDVLDRYIELLREDFSPRAGIGRVKQLVSQMCRGYAWRKSLLEAPSMDEQATILSAIRSGEWTAPARGELLVRCDLQSSTDSDEATQCSR